MMHEMMIKNEFHWSGLSNIKVKELVRQVNKSLNCQDHSTDKMSCFITAERWLSR